SRPQNPVTSPYARAAAYQMVQGNSHASQVCALTYSSAAALASVISGRLVEKSLCMYRTDRCPLLFENLFRFLRYRLHNCLCRADCGHERCAVARGQAHFFKVTRGFRSRKDGSKLWHQIFPAAKHRFADGLRRIGLWRRLSVVAFPLTYYPVAYHPHRSIRPLGTENASPRNILLCSLRVPAFVFIVCV